MNRSKFLKAAALTTAVLTVAAIKSSPIKPFLSKLCSIQPVQISLDGKLLRGTRGGKMLGSKDEGKTWQEVFNFGSKFTILDLTERSGLIYAQLGFQQLRFTLCSTDGQSWLTIPS